MYHKMMKLAVKPHFKSTHFCANKSYFNVRAKEISYVGFKSYQKLFFVIISLSSILIFPEMPRELENICEYYNSRKMCNVL